MLSEHCVPVLGFAAFSGSGKTTLLSGVIPLLIEKGIRLSVIKHTHHGFDIDEPGKDSYVLRKSGAFQTLIASSKRVALITEYSQVHEPDLNELLEQLDMENIDLVLVEGFRHLAMPKIEIHRPSTGKEKIFPGDENIIAVASDEQIDTGALPLLDLNNPDNVADFILEWINN